MTVQPVEKKRRGRPSVGDRPMTAAERQARRLAKLKSGQQITSVAVGTVEVTLHQLAQQAASNLIPQIMEKLRDVRSVFEQAEAIIDAGKSPNKGQFMKDTRDTCQWLTDALEQLTQCSAVSRVQTVHQTKLARQAYTHQVWGDIAALCRDISSSHAWEKIKANDMPDLIRRGVAVFGKIAVT